MICAITGNDVRRPPPSRAPPQSRSCAIRVCGFRDVTMVAHYRLAIGPLLPVRESRNGPYRVRRGVIPGRTPQRRVTRPFSTGTAAGIGTPYTYTYAHTPDVSRLHPARWLSERRDRRAYVQRRAHRRAALIYTTMQLCDGTELQYRLRYHFLIALLRCTNCNVAKLRDAYKPLRFYFHLTRYLSLILYRERTLEAPAC